MLNILSDAAEIVVRKHIFNAITHASYHKCSSRTAIIIFNFYNQLRCAASSSNSIKHLQCDTCRSRLKIESPHEFVRAGLYENIE